MCFAHKLEKGVFIFFPEAQGKGVPLSSECHERTQRSQDHAKVLGSVPSPGGQGCVSICQSKRDSEDSGNLQ